MDMQPISLKTERLALAGFHNGIVSGRPIIALHGWLDNAASYSPLASLLNVERPFYAMELPGHGLSEHRPSSCSYQLLENIVDVAALVAAIAPDGGPVTLVGHSLGGIICSLYAAASPERVDKLLLLDSLGPMTDEVESVLPQRRKAMRKAELFRSSKLVIYPSIEMAAKVRMSGVGKVSADAAKLLVERGLKSVEGGYQWTSDPRLMEPSFLRFSEEQVQAIFGGIECPVCLVCGDKGYYADYSALRARLSYIKTLEKHLVQGGHHFHMDGDVSATVEIMNEFFQS